MCECKINFIVECQQVTVVNKVKIKKMDLTLKHALWIFSSCFMQKTRNVFEPEG